MSEELETIVWLSAAVLVIVAVGTAVTFTIRRQRRTVWERFARRHGLRFSEEASEPHVAGRIDGRALELTAAVKSSDDELGVEGIALSLSLNIPADVCFQAHRGEGMLSAVDRAADPQSVLTGDDNFDRNVVVTADSPVQCLPWLTPARRGIVRRLVEENPEATVSVKDSQITIEDRNFIPRIELLDDWLKQLRTAAERIDAEAARDAEQGKGTK